MPSKNHGSNCERALADILLRALADILLGAILLLGFMLLG